jgi:hypothetical protein
MNDSKPFSEEDVLLFLLEGADRELESEIKSAFPEATLSPADNFLGGLEIAVFLRPLKDVVSRIVRFATDHQNRYKSASVTINGKRIDIKGYGPDDVVRLIRTITESLPPSKM